MSDAKTFQRRGIIEGFFGPLWSMAHRKALFEFGAARGMNTYLGHVGGGSGQRVTT